MMVPEHSLYIQILNPDDLVFAHQFCGFLVQEIVSDISDRLMDSRKFLPLFLYVAASQ